MAVPYTFGNATTSIPLSQLDSNFATTITLGNTAIQLGNTVTTLNNMTLANVTISSGTSNLAATAITNGTSNVTIASSGGNIAMATNGATAITVDTSQNVGIGTASPNIGGYGANSRILTVQGVSGSYAIAELSSNSANSDDVFVGRLDFSSDGQAANYKNVASIASALSGSTSTKFGANLQFYTRANNAGSGSPIERMRLDPNGNLLFNSGYGSVATAYGCRAWVNFNGTGTVAIRGSGNVSSITDNGTGSYLVNFTTSMPDVNYAVGGLMQPSVSNAGSDTYANFSAAMASRVDLSHYEAGTLRDSAFVSCIVFR